jgi:chemotaxis-related protein WspB
VLLLLLDLDGNRYALDTRQVVEVLPLVRIKQIPEAPRGVAGLMNYRGAPVPVIDLASLVLGRPSRASLSTRLVIVHYPDGRDSARLVGLVAEHATETVRRPEQDFIPSGVTVDAAAYAGPVAIDARGLVQLIDVATLLPPSVRDVLFRPAVAV